MLLPLERRPFSRLAISGAGDSNLIAVDKRRPDSIIRRRNGIEAVSITHKELQSGQGDSNRKHRRDRFLGAEREIVRRRRRSFIQRQHIENNTVIHYQVDVKAAIFLRLPYLAS